MMAEDPYLLGRIEEALAKDPRVGELELDVRVVADRIYLSGRVATEERCRAAVEVVREVAPGHDVSNQLTVVREPGPGSDETLS
jgi:osmotically-inducible protein OsmY